MASLNKLLLRGKDPEHSQPETSSSFSQGSVSSQSKPKVPVILKRKEGIAQSTDTSSSRDSKQSLPAASISAADERSSNASTKLTQSEKKPLILQRTGTPSENQQDRDRSGGGSAPSAGISLYDLLKPYEFPYEQAVPIIHNDLSFKSNRKFLKPLKSTVDYLVVTVIGPPRSGKSTILNFLANTNDTEDLKSLPKLFLPRKENDEEELCTFYITTRNIIFIEMASIFNGAAAVDLIPTVDKYSTLESVTVSWNLRLMRWALSVSHLVIMPSLSVIEPSTIQLIHSAANLHPMENAFGGNSHPELVFVGSKCNLPKESKEQLISLCSTADVIGFGRRTRIKPNIFVLPDFKDSTASVQQSYEEFRRKIYEYNQWTRSSFTEDEIDGQSKIPQNVTMNDWFTFASISWEEMGHSGYYQDYVRLLN